MSQAQFNFIRRNKKKRGKNRVRRIKAEQVGSYQAEIHGQMATIRKFQTVRQIDPMLEASGYYPNLGFLQESMHNQPIQYGEYYD